MRKHGPISHRETTLEKLHARGHRGGRGTHRTRSPLTNGRRGALAFPVRECASVGKWSRSDNFGEALAHYRR